MYEIKKLNYNETEMEPYIDSKTFRIQKNLQKEYLDKLNQILIKNKYDFRYEINDLVNHLNVFMLEDRGDILFNLGGYLNHTNYLNNISPYKKNVLNGKIKDAIINKYGTFSNFKNIFINEGLKLVGNGYLYLVLDSNLDLNIITLSNEEIPYTYGFTPLITLDLWEHAYFLKYNLNKKRYIEDFFNIIDFVEVNNLYIEKTKKQ